MAPAPTMNQSGGPAKLARALITIVGQVPPPDGAPPESALLIGPRAACQVGVLRSTCPTAVDSIGESKLPFASPINVGVWRVVTCR